MKILAIYGTRPEFLKIKPIIEKNNVSIKTCFIQQHTNIINFGKSDFTIKINDICNNRLNSIFSEIVSKAEQYIKDFDYILIQGDTATVAASALTAYHLRKKIIYLESGLRTYDFDNPYPEEGYRQMVARIADLNLCPTNLSAKNLKKEKVKGKIFVVGNTSLDNIVQHKKNTTYGNKVLLTLHRNENLQIIDDWLLMIDQFAKNNSELQFVFPVHPNPHIIEASKKLKYIKITNPLEHIDLLNILKDARFVITDSGGIQEEACFLNKKIVVCRKTTERPEGIKTGHIFLCRNPLQFQKIATKINENPQIYSKCPYGDGKSSEKILKLLNLK